MAGSARPGPALLFFAVFSFLSAIVGCVVAEGLPRSALCARCPLWQRNRCESVKSPLRKKVRMLGHSGAVRRIKKASFLAGRRADTEDSGCLPAIACVWLKHVLATVTNLLGYGLFF